MVPLRHHHKVTTAVDTRITWTILDDLILHIEYVLLLSLVLALFAPLVVGLFYSFFFSVVVTGLVAYHPYFNYSNLYTQCTHNQM